MSTYKLAFTRLLQGGDIDIDTQKENFRRFLEKVLADECFDFYNQTQTLEDCRDPSELTLTAQTIWDTFLAPQAPRVVNLSGDTVSACLVHLSNPFPNMFRNAKKEIFNLMFVNYGLEFIEREGLLEKLTIGNKAGTVVMDKVQEEKENLQLSWANPLPKDLQEDPPTSAPQSEPHPLEVSWRKLITPRWFKAPTGPPGSISGSSSPRLAIDNVNNLEFAKPSLAVTRSVKSNDSLFDHFPQTFRPQTTRELRKSYDFPVDRETPEPLSRRRSLPKKSSLEKSQKKPSERKSVTKPNSRALKSRTSKKPNRVKSEPTSPKILRKNNGKTEIENIPKKLTTSSGIENGKTEIENFPRKLTASSGRVNSEPFRSHKKPLENMSQSATETNSNSNSNPNSLSNYRRRAFSSRRPLRQSSRSISVEKSADSRAVKSAYFEVENLPQK